MWKCLKSVRFFISIYLKLYAHDFLVQNGKLEMFVVNEHFILAFWFQGFFIILKLMKVIFCKRLKNLLNQIQPNL